jgi:hypothetical protein
VISYSWSKAGVCEWLRGASSVRFLRCNLLVQSYHWWRELVLRLWPWGKKNPPNGIVQTHRDRKRRDRWIAKSRAKSMLIIFFAREFVMKNSSWQGKHSLAHTTVKLYGDCVKMCEEFTPKFRDKRTGCCITTTHLLTLLFSSGNLWPKTTRLTSPTHPTRLACPAATFLCFPDWR